MTKELLCVLYVLMCWSWCAVCVFYLEQKIVSIHKTGMQFKLLELMIILLLLNL